MMIKALDLSASVSVKENPNKQPFLFLIVNHNKQWIRNRTSLIINTNTTIILNIKHNKCYTVNWMEIALCIDLNSLQTSIIGNNSGISLSKCFLTQLKL